MATAMSTITKASHNHQAKATWGGNMRDAGIGIDAHLTREKHYPEPAFKWQPRCPLLPKPAITIRPKRLGAATCVTRVSASMRISQERNIILSRHSNGNRDVHYYQSQP